MKPTLLILAAGMGSRYGGIKQLDKFGPTGETLMEYAVFDAIRAGFGKVVFIIREDFAQEFKERFHDIFAKFIEVAYVFQEIPQGRTKPWGTAQAVLCAKNVINEPFAVINADDYYGPDGFKQMGTYLQNLSPERMSMMGYILENTLSDSGTVNRGVCKVTKQGDKVVLSSIKECLKLGRQEDGLIRDKDGDVLEDRAIVSMNFWGCHPVLFGHIEEQFKEFVADQPEEGSTAEFFIPLVIDKLIHTGEIECEVLVSHDIRCGVTYQEDKPFVEEVIKRYVEETVYPHSLWNTTVINQAHHTG